MCVFHTREALNATFAFGKSWSHHDAIRRMALAVDLVCCDPWTPVFGAHRLPTLVGLAQHALTMSVLNRFIAITVCRITSTETIGQLMSAGGRKTCGCALRLVR